MEIVELVQNNMLDYAGAVNQSRAIPDARTGLKPIHRKILYEMYADKIKSSGKFKKCAYMVGQIIARFSEHGDAATYDALVRLAQPWIQRYPLLDFHGNYGSQFGDEQAAMRYTESKLSPLAEDGLLATLDKGCVEWIPNFTQEEQEPVTLPAVFPGLFCLPNQGMGYAVACHFVTYNLKEVADYIVAAMNDAEELPVIYPDFASGGVLVNPQIAAQVQATGKGSFIVEGKYTIEGNKIIFTEIPFNVAFDDIYDSIIELCKNEELTFITDLVNDSGENGLKLIIEIDKNVKPEDALEVIFNKTKLRNSYPVNQTALVNNKPKLLSFKDMADVYVEHNTTCIRLEHENGLENARMRIEILEGLLKALSNIDEVIEIIRTSDTPKEKLMTAFELSERQVKAILDMKLGRLSKLEVEKINKELQERREFAAYCEKVIENYSEQKRILEERLQELVKKYGDERRTEICQKEIKKISTSKAKEKIDEVPQDIVVTLNNNGYLKAIPVAQYKKEKNLVAEFKCTTKDLILCFTSAGKYYRVSPKDIGLCGPKDKGKAAGAVLKMDKDEKLLKIFTSIVDEKHPYILQVTDNGLVKKTDHLEFIGSTRNLNGMKCMGLDDNKVVYVAQSNGDTLSLISTDGYSVSFPLDDMRATGKTSKGVIGMKLNEGQQIKTAMLNSIPEGGKITKRGAKGQKIKC